MAKTPSEGDTKPVDAKEEDGTGIVKFTAPPGTWAYLGWLSRNTVLGKTESEVARQLLIQTLAQMRQEDYKWDLPS